MDIVLGGRNMKKFVVKCFTSSGEIINEFTLEAHNETEARIKSHEHPEYDASMMKAHERGIHEYQFVIYDLAELN